MEEKKRTSRSDRIEIFSQAIVAGKSQADAYRAAYPTSLKWKADHVHTAACEMAKEPNVLRRIEEIRGDLKEKGLWSMQESIEGLRNIVHGDYRGSEKVSAIKELNSMHGFKAATKIDHTSTDGTMSPKALDTSKLSENTMKELLEARPA